MPSAHQVIKYAMVDFDKNWTRDLLPNEVVRYTAKEVGILAVVFEGATGVMTTYHYKLVAPVIEVLIVEDAIHIPGRCIKQEPGNTIKCG